MYETCVSRDSVKENCPGKESTDLQEDTSKIRITLWCSCGKYKPMATHAESICCLDRYEVRERYFKDYFHLLLKYFYLVIYE